MSDLTFAKIRRAERKWIRNHLIIAEIITFIFAMLVYEAFGGARDLSAVGAIVAAVIISLIAGLGTLLILGPIVMYGRDIVLYDVPDLMDENDGSMFVRFLSSDNFFGIRQDQFGVEDFYEEKYYSRAKVKRWDIMKAYIAYIVILILSIAAVVISWILILRSGPVSHYEGNVLHYDENIISIHENFGVLLAVGLCSVVICGTLMIRRFIYLTQKSCSKCRALGSIALEEIMESKYDEYDKSYTVEDEYYVGTKKVRDEELGIDEYEEEEVYVSVPRDVTNHYKTYSAQYRCRCIYCGKERKMDYFSITRD